MSKTDNEIPSYIEDLLEKMDFIGDVPPGMKICIKSKRYIDPAEWSTPPYRWWYGESAIITCNYIKTTIYKLHEILKEFNSPNAHLRMTIIEKAKKLRQGICNLINVYHENADAVSKLRTSLDILDIRLPENRVTRSNENNGLFH